LESQEAFVGSCLCGAVTYRAKGHIGVFQYCHCSRCRKFTGSAHSANLLVDPGDFEWLEGESSVGRYELPNARHFATGFCKICGSSLPWLAQSGKVVVIPAGTIDTAIEIRPMQNVFCASSATWYRPVGELPSYEELPPRKE
jgi:hypothetical protein